MNDPNDESIRLLYRLVELEKELLQAEQNNTRQRENTRMLMAEHIQAITVKERMLMDEADSIRRKRYAFILHQVAEMVEDL